MKKLLINLIFLSFVNQAFAQGFSNKEVGNFVEKIGNDIVAVANQKISEEKKRQEIIKIIDNSIDSKWIARFVLSKNYRFANQLQRDRFQELYRQFMINTYGPKFKDYNGRKFTVNNVSKQKSFYLVKAEFLPRDSNVPISVDFRVRESEGKLFVLDFIGEGVSLIETQRSEFNSAIAENGMDGFLKILQKRVEDLSKK
jgi:phospholipid transport system substrate-binding protein